MRNEDLERLARESINADRDLPFDESAWDDLSRKLDKNLKSGIGLLWWFLLGALLILPWGIIFQQGQKLDATKAKVAQLANSKRRSIITDTIYQIKEQVITDTIYLERVKEKRIFIPSAEPSQKINALYLDSISHLTKVVNRLLDSLSNRMMAVEASEIISEEEDADLMPLELLISKQIISTTTEKHNQSTAKALALPTIENTGDHSPFRFGFLVGKDRYKTPEVLSDSMFRKGIENNFIFEMIGEIELYKGLNLKLGLGYEELFLRNQGDIGGLFALDSLPQEYDLADLKVKRSGPRYHLGLQYNFFPEKRIKPIIGASLIAHSHQQTTAISYYNTFSPYLEPFEHNIIKEDKKFRINYLLLDAGVRFRVLPKFSIQGGGHYYISVNNARDFHPDWGLKAGIIFHY